MHQHRRPDREYLEIYLLYLLLRNRQILILNGVVILLYAVAMVFWSIPATMIAAGLAISLLMIAFSYRAALYAARIGAWLAYLKLRNY